MSEPPGDFGSGGRPARFRPFLDADVGEDTPPDGVKDRRAVRPFVMTSGRVQGTDPAIGLETQVTARPWLPGGVRLTPEQEAIIELCGEPISVAEISARLHLHLGVAKILVGDLHAAGYLDLHIMDLAERHDPETILRVMRGLRAIS